MNKKRSIRLITVLGGGLMLLLVQCASALTFSAANPKEPGPDGAALYGSNCAICHGRNGTGTPQWKGKGQPDLSSAEWQRSHSDDQIAERIKAGKGKMPAFGKKLSEEQVMALVKQVRNLKK